MNYNFKDEGLEIKFTWKERFTLFMYGHIKMNFKESFHFSTALMSLVNACVQKYGDSKKHGFVKIK